MNLANSVNECPDRDISVVTLGREIRVLQSDPDRYRATAEKKPSFSDPPDFSGFNDPLDFSGFNDPLDFSGFSDPLDFSGFSDPLDFSGFSDPLDFSGFSDSNDLSSFNDRTNRIRDGKNRSSENCINNRHNIRVGTWNVRTLARDGKFEEVEKEMKRMKLNILGISEARWTGAGVTPSKDITFYYSGGEKREKE